MAGTALLTWVRGCCLLEAWNLGVLRTALGGARAVVFGVAWFCAYGAACVRVSLSSSLSLFCSPSLACVHVAPLARSSDTVRSGQVMKK